MGMASVTAAGIRLDKQLERTRGAYSAFEVQLGKLEKARSEYLDAVTVVLVEEGADRDFTNRTRPDVSWVGEPWGAQENRKRTVPARVTKKDSP